MMKLIREIIAGIFIVSFLYALFAPLQMTRYTLTDGQHTIVFQSMIHIAHPEFYKAIESDAKYYTDNGYTFLYEGITAGKHDRDNKANIPSYDMISYMYGLDSQATNSYFLTVHNLHGIGADVDSDWILTEFKNHDIKVGVEKPMTQQELIVEKNFIDVHHKLIIAVGLPLMRLSDRFASVMEYYREATNTHSPMMEVILVDRNKVLYNYIANTSNDKIYINYGSAHFLNLYDLLKDHNSKWHIIEKKNYNAF